MSDRRVPVRANVWENLNLGTPDEDQPRPFIDGKDLALVYDLSGFAEENGVLVRQPTTVESPTGTRDQGAAFVSGVTPGNTQSDVLISSTSDEIRLRSISVFAGPDSGSGTGVSSGQIFISVGTGIIFRYTFENDFQPQRLTAANSTAAQGYRVPPGNAVELSVTNDAGSADDIRGTVNGTWDIL